MMITILSTIVVILFFWCWILTASLNEEKNDRKSMNRYHEKNNDEVSSRLWAVMKYFDLDIKQNVITKKEVSK